MNISRKISTLATVAFLTVAVGSWCSPGASADDTPSRSFLGSLTGVPGGIAVHVGCGEGRQTMRLADSGRFLVLGLDTDRQKVAAARQFLSKNNCLGAMTVATFDGKNLPLVDNAANVVLVESSHAKAIDDVVRALAPGGVLLVAGNSDRTSVPKNIAERFDPSLKLGELVEIDGQQWACFVKRWPNDIDEWTHHLHDATNNAVACDTRIGPPKHVQWIGSPTYLRHHDHMSGLSAMVSAAGRVFYIMDMGPRWSIQMPPRWTLVARDAFNGVVLWRRRIENWHPHLWPLKKGPAQLMRRLVAEGDVVYVTLGVGERISVLDAKTGEVMRELEGTAGAEEILVADGALFALVNPLLDAYRDIPTTSVESIRGAGRDWNWDEQPRQLRAINAESGTTIWSRETRVAPTTMAAVDGRLYFHNGEKVVCLEAKSGDDVWSTAAIPRWSPMHVLYGPTLVLHDNVVLFSGGEKMDPFKGGRDTMTAVDAQTGKTLWKADHPSSGYASAEDLLVVDGLVWCGSTTSRGDSGIFTGRDPRTGEVVRQFPPDDWQPHMPHHRCHKAKAAGKYILTSRTGIEFVDVREKHWTSHHWVRGSCNYGIMPCNGLVYAPPHSCACYPLAKLSGFHALASKRPIDTQTTNRSPRLAKTVASPSPITDPPPATSAWPTFRGSAGRSGSTDVVVPTDLKLAWKTKIGDRLTAPVVADGLALVADIDRHALHAISADTGAPAWTFIAGGRIDSPPTNWRGHVLFGSADGYIYCLRAADGAEIWRFRAAPTDRRLFAKGQLESVWPVHGSVLVLVDPNRGADKATVYCVAGRSMWLDGGLRMLRLDAQTGELLSENVLDDRYPGTEDNLQHGILWPNLPTALPDVLSSDGKHVYMRAQPFDLTGKRTEVVTPRRANEQDGPTAHLFSPTGFLDDSWWHRTYWIFGRSFIGGAGGWSQAAYATPSGRILAVDDGMVYGFGRLAKQVRGTPNAYHLFACDVQPELIETNERKSASNRRPIPTRVKYAWSKSAPLLVRGIVSTRDSLFVGGPPVVADEGDVYLHYDSPEIQDQMAEHVAAFAGEKGSLLLAVAKTDGERQAAYRLDSAPVFDGIAAVDGRLYATMLDGSLVCLSSQTGKPLEPAPEARLSAPVAVRAGPIVTKTHPDFQHVSKLSIRPGKLDYRLASPAANVPGLALKRLESPITNQAVLRVKIRPRPDDPPDSPGNAWLVVGDQPTDEDSIKCGFRLAGQNLYAIQGPLLSSESVSTKVSVEANVTTELVVSLDLAKQTVAATLNGKSVELAIDPELKQVSWIGYCVAGPAAEFGKIVIEEND
jgi:outer membrane protein assembly factor BamB/SAM-dependent methyltransferase